MKKSKESYWYTVNSLGHLTTKMYTKLNCLKLIKLINDGKWPEKVWYTLKQNNQLNNLTKASFQRCLAMNCSRTIDRSEVIIMSCRQHGYPWPSLATSPYHSLLLAGLQGYIPYPHIAAVCMFELVVLLLLGHMRGSIGVHNWWVHPCFSSSVLHVWFV